MRVRTHTNPFNYYQRLQPIDWSSLWSEFDGTLDFEIGFGRGVFFRHWCQKYTDRFLVGAEIRRSVVDILRDRLNELCISNQCILHGNAEIILQDCFGDHSIDNIFLFHPDPWFKKRHHKRRVLRKKFLDMASKKMKKNGKLYISTDVKELWEAMVDTIESHPDFSFVEADPFWEEDYNTHWHIFREKDGRDFFRGTIAMTGDV